MLILRTERGPRQANPSAVAIKRVRCGSSYWPNGCCRKSIEWLLPKFFLFSLQLRTFQLALFCGAVIRFSTAFFRKKFQPFGSRALLEKVEI
jgi:hypothetical protein